MYYGRMQRGVNPAPDPAKWVERTLHGLQGSVYFHRWAIAIWSDPAAFAAARDFVSTSFSHYAIGLLDDTHLLCVLRKERQGWKAPPACSDAALYTLPPTCKGRVRSQEEVTSLLLSLQAACQERWFTLEAVPNEEEGIVDDAALFDSIVSQWMLLSPREIDTQIALARHVSKTRKRPTPQQSMMCSSSVELRRTVEREIRLTGTIRYPLSDSRIPSLSSFDKDVIRSLVGESFDPVSGELVHMPVTDWLTKCGYLTKCLVLLGAPAMGKTPLAKTLAKLTTTSWGGEHAPASTEPFFACTSQVDSLRLLSRDMWTGCGIVLDEFDPQQAHGGRSRHLAENDLKELLSCCGGTIGTRYGDTCLPAGPRICTSNSDTLQAWAGIAADGFQSCSIAQRKAMCRDRNSFTGAIMKRCIFVFLTRPVVAEAAKRQREEAMVEEQSKRMRAALREMDPSFEF